MNCREVDAPYDEIGVIGGGAWEFNINLQRLSLLRKLSARDGVGHPRHQWTWLNASGWMISSSACGITRSCTSVAEDTLRSTMVGRTGAIGLYQSAEPVVPDSLIGRENNIVPLSCTGQLSNRT